MIFYINLKCAFVKYFIIMRTQVKLAASEVINRPVTLLEYCNARKLLHSVLYIFIV